MASSVCTEGASGCPWGASVNRSPVRDGPGTLGTELNAQDRAYVLSAYLYRMTAENLRSRPGLRSIMCGYRMPVIPDAEWLARTRFFTTNAGRLDLRMSYCETAWTPEERAAAA